MNNYPEKKKDKRLDQSKIGIIHSGSANTPGVDEAIDTFFVGLQALGWDESNLTILPTAFADGSPQTLNQIAAQMITDDVTVLIAAGGTAAALAGQAATATQITKTPVVFTSVRDWTTSAANSNLTGIIAQTSTLDPERLELLCDTEPHPTHFGLLVNSARPDSANEVTTLRNKATSLGVTNVRVESINPTGGQIPNQIGQAFQAFRNAGVNAVLVTADPLFNTFRRRIINEANRKNNPLRAIYQWRHFANQGGLMSYGTRMMRAYRMAGVYVGKILNNNGQLPADLKVRKLAPELVVNLVTAGKFSTPPIPELLIARADEVIR